VSENSGRGAAAHSSMMQSVSPRGDLLSMEFLRKLSSSIAVLLGQMGLRYSGKLGIRLSTLPEVVMHVPFDLHDQLSEF
jgi:hypothetical protein